LVQQTVIEFVGRAAIGEVDDAGRRITDVDGFAYLCGRSAGCENPAASAIASGMARCVVCVDGLQQAAQRCGTRALGHRPDMENRYRDDRTLFRKSDMVRSRATVDLRPTIV